MILSGDRESEVRDVADQVGIGEVHAEISPEGKLDITRAPTSQAPTLFLGDGINDAPAMIAASVGVAFGATGRPGGTVHGLLAQRNPVPGRGCDGWPPGRGPSGPVR